MGKMKEKTIALLEKHGVFFDADGGRWISTEEVLEKRYGVRFDDNEGRWVTTENDNRVHISPEGVPDKGNPFVLAVMKGEDPKKVVTRKQRVKMTLDESRTRFSNIRQKVDRKARELKALKKNATDERITVYRSEKDVERAQRAFDKALKKRNDAIINEGLDPDALQKEYDELKPQYKELEKQAYEISRSKMAFGVRNNLTEEEDKTLDQFYEMQNRMSELKQYLEPFEYTWARDTLKREQDYKDRHEKMQKDYEEQIKNFALDTEDAREYEESAKARNAATLEMFKSPKDLTTSEDVNDYIRAKGYCRIEGDSEFFADERVDVKRMAVGHAKALAERLDGLVENYPWLSGAMKGVFADDKSAGTYAATNTYRNDITFNTSYYGENAGLGDIEQKYAQNVEDGFHPKGTKADSIVDHEFAHLMETIIDGGKKPQGERASDVVMERVLKRMKLPNNKNNRQMVRESICKYSGNNDGVKRLPDGTVKELRNGYGANTEFLAEAMAEARCSESPSETAVMVREEFEKLIRERGFEVK